MSSTLQFLSLQIILLFVVTSVHTYLGLHVIRRGIVFSDLALDQLAALGIIIGIGFGIQGSSLGAYLISLIMVILGSIFLSHVKPDNKKIPHEAVIGILYGVALMISLMIADKISGGLSYVTQALTGTMLWVNGPLVIVTVVVYTGLALFHYKFREKIIAITEGSLHPKDEAKWDFLFFITLGVITVLIVPIAGVLLAYAFLMIPAATAALFTKGWTKGLIIGWGTGFIASLFGLFTSYSFNLPYGPTLVLSLGVCFAIGLIIKCFSCNKETYEPEPCACEE